MHFTPLFSWTDSLFRPSVCPIFVNVRSLEHLRGNPSDLAHTCASVEVDEESKFWWSQVKGHCDLTSVPCIWIWYLRKDCGRCADFINLLCCMKNWWFGHFQFIGVALCDQALYQSVHTYYMCRCCNRQLQGLGDIQPQGSNSSNLSTITTTAQENSHPIFLCLAALLMHLWLLSQLSSGFCQKMGETSCLVAKRMKNGFAWKRCNAYKKEKKLTKG